MANDRRLDTISCELLATVGGYLIFFVERFGSAYKCESLMLVCLFYIAVIHFECVFLAIFSVFCKITTTMICADSMFASSRSFFILRRARLFHSD